MIIIKSDMEIEYMRNAGKVVADTLATIEAVIKPGITTAEINKLAEEFILEQGAKPSFKGYGGFPASICASVNDEVIHGIPDNRVLQEGDIISVDCGAVLNGFHGDAARTFPVGKISKEAEELIRVTKECFFKGVEKAKVNNRLTDISAAVQIYAESFGYSVVRDFVGHGIGKSMHEDPQVPNYGTAGRGPKLSHGMVLAIEPMINIGKFNVKVKPNGWTVVTSDGSLSAHYENTVAILNSGPEILTLS
ncbi:methionine aminopeptidase, type I [Clostridium argentinense CDC 2741]|uniref:Methionine aminopeptidase n=1 Tax=Clostridium argentinense CDC 2741 TaxID=1418104 RepID=A0A0C1R2Z9_9CLOT|nr:type I methionyl aminopeptidase [Clostridium argentinense]ARC83699.1 type I methionyl aminopeptidase [Clostridium argentinense]KIE47902.1 methionine aminopeptidase, type I [Clostridium argentinense CDC 2741]NFF41068.1 type I methionyl aminopeptidase [Clostridium argentinense]NFP51990.1 type I methionyl aminopeptidase [Clostridium argentinense]NFP73740.1 type I methionyl aminopeptidase [Clostridium argentinense]